MLLKRLLIMLFVLGFPCSLLAAASGAPSHMDNRNLPYGCGSCHMGFDFRTGGASDGCVRCHTAGTKVPQGFLASQYLLKDIEREFKKPYRHPTFDVRGAHSSGETLPETDRNAIRHADCVDCHNPHMVTPQNRVAGIKGKRVGNIVADVTREYELCYLCHSESANLPANYTNKHGELSVTNPSFHPVEGEGKNQMVVSLIKPYKEKKVNPTDVSMISCHDCHGSDDSRSPSGPHGSNNQYILVDNYSTRDKEPESPLAYALCYRCHKRDSILGNESFKFHSRHIIGRSGAAPDGTSCYTCHNSHGSTDHRYLIKFNPALVTPNARGVLKYVEKGINAMSGDCYLSCHGVDHDPKSY